MIRDLCTTSLLSSVLGAVLAFLVETTTTPQTIMQAQEYAIFIIPQPGHFYRGNICGCSPCTDVYLCDWSVFSARPSLGYGTLIQCSMILLRFKFYWTSSTYLNPFRIWMEKIKTIPGSGLMSTVGIWLINCFKKSRRPAGGTRARIELQCKSHELWWPDKGIKSQKFSIHIGPYMPMSPYNKQTKFCNAKHKLFFLKF